MRDYRSPGHHTWFDTNQPMQPQKMSTLLKFHTQVEEELYYSYCTADLCLCFCIGKMPLHVTLLKCVPSVFQSCHDGAISCCLLNQYWHGIPFMSIALDVMQHLEKFHRKMK